MSRLWITIWHRGTHRLGQGGFGSSQRKPGEGAGRKLTYTWEGSDVISFWAHRALAIAAMLGIIGLLWATSARADFVSPGNSSVLLAAISMDITLEIGRASCRERV